MATIEIHTDKQINGGQLDIELTSAFGERYIHASRGNGVVYLTLSGESGTDLTTFQGVINNHDHTVLTEAQRLHVIRQDILTLADKAKDHADKIALCFSAIVAAEESGDNAAEMFTRITNALNDDIVSNGFRALVMTAFNAQTGLSFDLDVLGVVVVGTKRAFNQFAANFFMRWAFMVSLAQ